MIRFSDLKLCSAIQKALADLNFTQPTEIQSQAIPALLQEPNADFHGQAQTGTGKTLAFGIPLIEQIDPAIKGCQALVVAPTRELVLQIVKSLSEVAKYTDVSIEAVYGGVSIMQQERALRKGVQIVVGTAGRLNDHLRRKTLKLDKLKTLVLDEADLMLDMGFKEEMDAIMSYAPENRAIWLFSATVKPGIKAIKAKHMRDPYEVRIRPKEVTTKSVVQSYCVVAARDRLTALMRMVDCAPDFFGIIFTQTKSLAADVAAALAKRGYSVEALHGDMNQAMRNKVIKKFKDKQLTMLVATDVAARGIDVNGLTHVVNYSLPQDQESYVHRIGRTGRAGAQGQAITFLSHSEQGRFKRMAQRLQADVVPFALPTMDQVVDARVAQAIASITPKEGISLPKGKGVERLKATLDNYSKEDLVDGMLTMLAAQFFVGVDKKIEQGPAISDKKASRFKTTAGMRELMINVGSIDGIKKQDVLRLILSSKQIQEADIERMRLIKKRTFFTVPAHCAQKIMRALHSKRLGGRKVHVQCADRS